MAQMRTDELRELLERYPHLDRRELRRLRELYRSATATEVIAIKSSATLARKAERLDDRDGSPGDVLLIAAAAALVGTAEVGVSAAMDYRFQSELVQVQHANHATGDGGSGLHIAPAEAIQKSLDTDLLGVRYGSGIDLAANVVLVGWVAALRGGRLGVAPRRTRTAG